MDKIVEGKIGESLAVNYLKQKGYKIITINWKNKVGEIDIIACDKKTIVFVEVKMRSSLSKGYPREAVGYHKQNKIRKLAESYLKENSIYERDCRFDVVEIIGDEKEYTIEHIENAFI